MIVNYDRHLFIVQATALVGYFMALHFSVASPANVRLAIRGLPAGNILAYFETALETKGVKH